MRERQRQPNVLYYVGWRLSTLRLVGFSPYDYRIRYLTEGGVFRQCGWARFWLTRLLSRLLHG